MKDWNAIQKRYLRDEFPIRLGGIAANLSRVKSFATHDSNREAVARLLEESKFFIEWTAGEADISIAAELVELQVQLLWQRTWDEIWQNSTQATARSQHIGQVVAAGIRVVGFVGLTAKTNSPKSATLAATTPEAYSQQKDSPADSARRFPGAWPGQDGWWGLAKIRRRVDQYGSRVKM